MPLSNGNKRILSPEEKSMAVLLKRPVTVDVASV